MEAGYVKNTLNLSNFHAWEWAGAMRDSSRDAFFKLDGAMHRPGYGIFRKIRGIQLRGGKFTDQSREKGRFGYGRGRELTFLCIVDLMTSSSHIAKWPVA